MTCLIGFFRDTQKGGINLIFPDDADGNALKLIHEQGANFRIPHVVDFFIAVPDKASGEKILRLIEKHGYNCSLEFGDEKGWTCYCSKSMMLVYEDIIRVQEILDELSKPYGGVF